jgi:hypothetical protein
MLNENRKKYIAICICVAAVYALVNASVIENALAPVIANSPPSVIENSSSSVIENSSPSVIASEAKQSHSSLLVFALVDMLAYALLLYLAGVLLFNIYHYAVPSNYSAIYKNAFVIIASLLTGALMLTLESFVIYLCYKPLYDAFSSIFLLRAFCTALIITNIRLSYLLLCFNTDNRLKTKPQPTAVEVAAITEKQQETPTVSDRFTVRIGQKIKIIPHDDILYISADGDYVSIHTNDGSYLKELTMNSAEDSLAKERFVRVHRSYIVNINSISRIERYGEKRLIVLHNTDKIKISPARYQVLRKILGV